MGIQWEQRRERELGVDRFLASKLQTEDRTTRPKLHKRLGRGDVVASSGSPRSMQLTNAVEMTMLDFNFNPFTFFFWRGGRRLASRHTQSRASRDSCVQALQHSRAKAAREARVNSSLSLIFDRLEAPCRSGSPRIAVAVAVQCIGSGLTALSTCRLWHPLVSLPPRGHAQPRRLALPRSLGSAALSAPPGSPIQPALVVAVFTLCLLPSSPTSSSRIVTTHRVPATLATCLSQANELFVSTQERPSIDPH